MSVEIVPVQIHWGNLKTLSSVLDLANCLMTQWPAPTDGDAYMTALMVCEAVLRGGEDDTAEHAREAFVAAALEAGLAIDDNDDPDWF